MWGKDAVEADERVTRWRYERGHACKEGRRIHDAMGLPAPWLSQRVGHASVGKPTQSLEAQRGARAVAEQALSSLVIARGDDNASVDVEASRAAGAARRFARDR